MVGVPPGPNLLSMAQCEDDICVQFHVYKPILPGYSVMKRNEISSYFKPCLFYLVRGWGTPKQNGHVIFVRPIFCERLIDCLNIEKDIVDI